MKNLKEFLEKIDEITNIVNRIGASGANGINTLTDRVGYLIERIEKSDYTYTNFHSLFDEYNKNLRSIEEINELKSQFDDFMKDLPEIKNKLNFNFVENFNTLFEKENFIEEWNALNEEQKSDILYIDKEIYKIIRQKIDVKEFDFLFKVDNQDSFDGSYPIDIFEWIESNSKVTFYKLRKAAQGENHEDFFNSQEVKDAENSKRQVRNQVAINYLINQKKFGTSDSCWYDRLDMLTNKGFAFHYTYHFFKDLEDEFNGYKKIQENINLPDILKKWSGQMIDPQYEIERAMFQKEVEGKSHEEYCEISKSRDEKYPTFKIAESLSRELKKDEFINLVNEAKGTEFEDFFSLTMTEKMHHEMPYKRIDYMFIYFRDKFINEVPKKLKLR